MDDIQSYEDLVAWQKAFELGLRIYEITMAFPPDERFGLTAQMRRGGVAVASNIAEGYGRGTRRDYAHFIHIARGALYELDTQIRFAQRLGYVSADVGNSVRTQSIECSKIIGGLLRGLHR